MPRPDQVSIENPLPGGNPTTSEQRALRYVRQGRAMFISPAIIRFLDTPLHRMVTQESMAQDTGYDRLDRTFYARHQTRHIPLINAGKMIREEKSSRNFSYTAGVRRSMRRDDTAEEVKQMRVVE